jgi:hypothetical protein
MRALLSGAFSGLLVLGFAQAASAQTILKREPHYLASGAVVFVDSGQCGVGKVMKVTGIFKGSSRRRTCVSINPQQATLDNVPAL